MNKTYSAKIGNNLEELVALCADMHKLMSDRALPVSAVYAADLVLEETITNIIKYGFDDTAQHEICVSLTIQKTGIVIVIEDDGHNFNPLMTPEPDLMADIAERKVGGVGIHLMKKIVDRIKHERIENRNRLIVEVDFAG